MPAVALREILLEQQGVHGGRSKKPKKLDSLYSPLPHFRPQMCIAFTENRSDTYQMAMNQARIQSVDHSYLHAAATNLSYESLLLMESLSWVMGHFGMQIVAEFKRDLYAKEAQRLYFFFSLDAS